MEERLSYGFSWHVSCVADAVADAVAVAVVVTVAVAVVVAKVREGFWDKGIAYWSQLAAHPAVSSAWIPDTALNRARRAPEAVKCVVQLIPVPRI